VVVLQPCKTCQGKGRQPETKKLSITVPAGVDNGTRLRVANEGNAGVLGGPPGDLYVVIEVQPHERFERDGYNVLSVHPVTYTQLALGAEVEVPTLRGTEKVRIQPGTQSGTVVQLKGAGVPFLQNPNHRGDHLVSLEIRIPTHLSGEEKKALYRLRELEDARQNEQDHPAKDSHPSIFDKMKDVLGGAH
jgi:molecular chaperone DnaJ